MNYVNNGVGLGAAGLKGKQIYDGIQERDQRGQQAFNGCASPTFSYTHKGQFVASGGIPGNCGTKKDHSRYFCCAGCYKKFK